MTFEEAKEELKSYIKMENSKLSKAYWIEYKKYGSANMTSNLSFLPKGTPKVNDMLAEKLVGDLRTEGILKREIADITEKQRLIVDKILKVNRPQQDVIFNIYVTGLSTETTAGILGYSIQHTWRLKKEAINQYANL